VKTRLAKINAERLQFHGIPPPLTPYTSLAVSLRRRTIPLIERLL
jgi:hypothetical protein